MTVQPYNLWAVDGVTVEVETPTITTRVTLDDLAKAVKFHDRDPVTREHFQKMLDEAMRACRDWRHVNGL